ncbi:hypothetical protein [Anaerotignum sp.]|uniref:hypothetical protein n=1 Tax=Anaerotignum sp. TaxID=2039241 RepID=UPI002715059B|nr:hypothetical protein [Anaerotignum sp.]
MLGILLAVLKFIGILLLSILLLFILIITVVLISPLKYQLAGEKKDELKGDFAAHWLFGLIRLQGKYIYGNEPQITLKILWFTLLGEKKKKRQKKRKTKPSPQPIKTGGTVAAREKTAASKKQASESIYMAESISPKKAEETQQTPSKEKTENPIANARISEALPPKPKVRRVKLSEIQEKPIAVPIEKEEDAFFTGTDEEEEGDSENTSMLDKLRFYKNKFQEIEEKREIFHAAKKLLKRLIKGISPNQLMLKATVGLGEPDYTGYLMGLVGVLTAKFGRNIRVKADFTRLVAEDIEINIKGKLVMGYFLYSLSAFLLKKPVRRILIKLWKGRKQNG